MKTLKELPQYCKKGFVVLFEETPSKGWLSFAGFLVWLGYKCTIYNNALVFPELSKASIDFLIGLHKGHKTKQDKEDLKIVRQLIKSSCK